MAESGICLLFGSLLLLIGIIGGGFEAKEINIPKVGCFPRAAASLAGVFFILLGIGLAQPAPTSPENENKSGTSTPILPTAAVDFAIYNTLGEGQVSEQVTVFIDGKFVGTLTINEHYRDAVITINVPEAGRYSYSVEARAVFNYRGQLFEYTGTGQGIINVEPGKEFDLAASISGDTWLVNLIER